MPKEPFADLLVRAAKAAGSLLDLAQLLGVEPRQVYRWIADVEQPSEERRRELEGRLSCLMPTAAAER
jgi:DNA-binding transcriptional regulator YdaS (Cro superfamily)